MQNVRSTVDIDAEILGTDLIDLDTILDDYFEIKPPFEEGEKKRKEFPDAFIANQVRKRFGDAEDVAIISNDTGFKKACQQSPHHFFFDSLGALFDRISREQTEAYAETIKAIEEMQERIKYYVLQYVKDNENIELRGLSYDKDGVVSGFDYDEVYLNGISDVDFRVHSVDEMSGNLSIVTLLCEAKIASESRLPDVLCYGDSIVIKGIDGSEMVLTIDEIAINPTEGSEEIIGIRLLNNQGELARGYVKLIVGYLDFDEDGGAADGIADEIEYEYSEIIKEIKDYVSDQEKKFKQELKITEIIGEALGAKGE